jgi:hypothetical protein
VSPEFILVSREGCHLCEAFLDELTLLQSELGFSVQRKDVDKDEQLLAKFTEKVPVLLQGNKILCQYFLDPDKVRTALNLMYTPGS